MRPALGSIPALTRAIGAGDGAALERLYRARADVLVSWVRRATGRDESFALDVLHDTMLRVVHRLPALPDEPALDAWLRRTALNAARDQIRSESRRAARQAESAARTAHHDATTRDADPARAAAHAETLERIATALAALGDDADPLRFRFALSWTLDRIGAALGLQAGGADGRIRRTALALRDRLEEVRHDA